MFYIIGNWEFMTCSLTLLLVQMPQHLFPCVSFSWTRQQTPSGPASCWEAPFITSRCLFSERNTRNISAQWPLTPSSLDLLARIIVTSRGSMDTQWYWCWGAGRGWYVRGESLAGEVAKPEIGWDGGLRIGMECVSWKRGLGTVNIAQRSGNPNFLEAPPMGFSLSQFPQEFRFLLTECC